MKVLFAVNNDNISEAIIKKYQKEYKEIISYKNVYYFNAILKELQHDKTYDRVVISEELEPFANNNYDTIDKFLFEKLDKISDEATKANGDNIEIILICSDRRSKSDEMLTKIFGIGIYNALIGEERSIDNLCKLMNQPRTKKEAKIAYKIEGTNIGYQAEDENSVSESEVQNILAHYKRLGKDEDRYVDSFNNIVSQYTDAQLRIIIRYLPINVKAVLEERSPKYQELSTFSVKNSGQTGQYKPKSIKQTKEEEKIRVQMLSNEKGKITKPIVIPSTLKTKNAIRKIETPTVSTPIVEEDTIDLTKDEKTEKKGRGRPRKNPIPDIENDKPKRGRGRPKKNVEPEEDIDIDLFSMDLEQDNQEEQNGNNNYEPKESYQEPEIDLFSMGDEEENINKQDEDEEIDLFSMDDDTENQKAETPQMNNMVFQEDVLGEPEKEENKSITAQKTNYNISNLNTVLTGEKKIVTFVGTTKNGTSFIVNNLALMLSSMNISTAILDTTQSKNAYYIFTKNEDQLRTLASNSIAKLEKGTAEGIPVNRNLTVYTELPGENQEHKDIENILITLMGKYDVVLIDADFNTPIEYFDKSQEIYLVQSLDILTIQPLTAFLRNLKSKGVLKQEKIKIVINKDEKVRSLSTRTLIGGMSSYNDPSMSFMTELFDKDNVQYCKIPFDIQNYVKYLDSLVNCEISLRGYTKSFIYSLNQLAGMVYPLLNQNKYASPKDRKRRMEFSDSTNNTLNKMKKNY